ncbi:hypothetical protein F5Y17DRAFT_455399 [Xylariaceae sp. FL0594]|nr:hypothetical protein F5Y17DRAFT_455399 [Xylariaceae sp. FL0594]
MSYLASKAEQPDMPVTDTNKVPSAGAKVTKNAPITQEATGKVASDSLAAESQAFQQANRTETGSSNQQGRPQEGGARAPGTSSTYAQGGGMGSKSSSGTGPSHVEPAPSYVNTQYHRDPHGPHGKNITEDNSIGTEDRSKNASFSAEIGSKDDPGRLAEQEFTLGDSAPAGKPPGRDHSKVSTETGRYDGLDDSREA